MYAFNNSVPYDQYLGGLPPLTSTQNKMILSQLEKTICKIQKLNGIIATGFLCRIPFPNNSRLLPVLITNNHVFNGNDISKKIGERTNGLWIPSTGGIYPLLKKFEKQGLVIGEWDDPKKKFQKIYRLTEDGKKDFEKKKKLLKPRIEESLMVFKLVYNDIY